MTDHATARPAGESYEVRVQGRPLRAPLRWLRTGWVGLSTLADGFLPYPVTGEVVVVGRADPRTELLRLPVSQDDFEATVVQVERDLTTLTAEALLAEWGAPR